MIYDEGFQEYFPKNKLTKADLRRMDIKKESKLRLIGVFPTISVVMPTLNSDENLDECLNAIRKQDYPQTKIEIIIIDGVSTDDTLKIAKKYNSVILNNPLKTAEAGKAIGIKKAKGEYILFLDSDNILESKDSIRKLMKHLCEPENFESKKIEVIKRWKIQ